MSKASESTPKKAQTPYKPCATERDVSNQRRAKELVDVYAIHMKILFLVILSIGY
ncbi:transmembrane protein, putative [Medicago truncatula]|uniref:Transmembrane protein, putative n=1 Tax=Medicago truncatula TaxID=3880 RepID=A0A072TG58_MEDTR|nr:transmembrane protein, putative [Medicago truncatula]